MDDKFRFRDGAKELIQRMFDRCIAGYGCRAIAKELNDVRVKTWSKGEWEEAHVRLILAGRAVVGECQPMKGSKGPRTPDGAPIPNYFPVDVDEKTWHAAQAARKLRDRRSTGNTSTFFRICCGSLASRTSR